MNANLPGSVSDLWFIAGWTMVHFLWLGTLIAAAAAVSRVALRRASANARYACFITWLALLAATPLLTTTWMLTHSSSSNAGAGIATGVAPNATIATITDPLAVSRDAQRSAPPEPTTPLDAPTAPSTPAGTRDSGSAGGSVANTDQYPTPANPRQSRGLTVPPPMFTTIVDQLNACVPYLPALWLLGTPITFALLVTGIVGTRRLSRASRAITTGPVADLLARLKMSLHITRRVTVAVCDRIGTPVLVGIIRPMILLPPAALTGWSPEEIEMVLLHELAHVRRWDNLVNLLQRCVESLLFFHPAVWLISSWARREREACCDAVVVDRTNRPHAYAEMLVALAAQMPRSVLFYPVASSAMAAGPLRSRIRRILQLEDDPMLVSGKSFALVIGSLLVAATLAVLYLPTVGHADEPAANDNPKITTVKENKDAPPRPALDAAIPNEQIPKEARDFSKAKTFPGGVSIKEFTAGLDQILASDDAKNKQIMIAWPDSIDGNLEDQIVKMIDQYVTGGRLSSVKFRRTTDDKIIVYFKKSQSDADTAANESDNPFDDAGSHDLPRIPKMWRGDEHTPVVERDYDLPTRFEAMFPNISKMSERLQMEKSHIRFSYTLTDSGKKLHVTAPEEVQRLFFKQRVDLYTKNIAATMAEMKTSPKFPSLEDQKLADLAWKVLNLELEPLNEKDLKRVKALGYDGGLKVTAAGNGGILANDLLVGLHVWPTTNMKSVAQILERNDLSELNPLKYYVIREEQTADQAHPEGYLKDVVLSSRIAVQLGDRWGDARRRPAAMGLQSRPTAPAATTDADPFANRPQNSPAVTPNADRYYMPRLAPKSKSPAAASDLSRSKYPDFNEPRPTPTVDPATGAPDNSAPVLTPSASPLAKPVPAVDDAKLPRVASSFPALTPQSTDENVDARPDRTIVAYDIPLGLKSDVEKYASFVHMQFLWDGLGRCIVQASGEQQKRFKSLLDDADKWHASVDKVAEPIAVKVVDGEPVFEWRAAGLTLVRAMPRTVSSPGGFSPMDLGNPLLVVKDVAAGSPAAWLDIQPGDMLAQIEKFSTGSVPEVNSILETLLAGYEEKDAQVKAHFGRSPKEGNSEFAWKTLPLRPVAETTTKPRTAPTKTVTSEGKLDPLPE